MQTFKSKMQALIAELEDERHSIMEKMRQKGHGVLDDWERIERIFEEEKNAARVKAHLLKLDLFEGWDKVVEKLEDHAPDKREVLARMHLARAGVLAEWDALEEKLAHLKDEAASLVDASEEKLRVGWETGKTLGKEIKALLGKVGSK